MKKLVLLFAAVLTLFAVSCEGTTSVSSSDLENTNWKFNTTISMEGISADIDLKLHLLPDEKFSMDMKAEINSLVPIPGMEGMDETIEGLWSYEAPYLYLKNEDGDALKCEVKGDKIYIDADEMLGMEMDEIVLEKY